MMADKHTNIKLSSQEAKSWRTMAEAFGIYIQRGIGTGDMGNAAEAIRRVAQAFQREPARVLTLLGPLLRENDCLEASAETHEDA
jgi:hypothetical protein